MAVKKIRAKWVIGIPEGAKVKVNQGDRVVAGQELIEVKSQAEEVVDMAREIGLLSVRDQEQLKESLSGKDVTEGEVLWQTTGWFTKKVVAKRGGRVIKIDEFNNFHVRLPEVRIKSIKSPVEAKVSKVGEGKLVLEFGATEYLGEVVTEGRIWGHDGMKYVGKIGDLSINDQGKFVIIDRLTQALMVKAEVLGIKGMVVKEYEKGDRIKTRLPVLVLEREEYDELIKEAGDEKYGVLLNATGGKLWLAVKKSK